MRLIKDGSFIADPFASIPEDAPLPADGVIVSLTRFRKDREALLERNAQLGVRLKSDESPEALGGDVHQLSVIVLEFPRFRDGRGFSWARMLRTRLGYKGEIRASGIYLYDQIAFMTRVGIDTFEVPESFTLAEFRRALGEISNVYQPAADDRKTIRTLRAAAWSPSRA